MKTLFCTFMYLCVSFSGLFAQEDQENAGIFTLAVNVNDAVRTRTVEKGGLLGGGTYLKEIPEEIIDSIKTFTVKMVSDYLEMPTELAYKERKKENFIEISGFYSLPGLPSQTAKKAIQTGKYDKYVSVAANFEPASYKTEKNGEKTDVKPRVRLTFMVYDSSKNVLEKKTAKRNDFRRFSSKKSGRKIMHQGFSGEKIYELYKELLLEALINS